MAGVRLARVSPLFDMDLLAPTAGGRQNAGDGVRAK